MKKIFFWTNYYIEHPEVGTTAKVISEIETLRLLGFEVSYTAYLDNGVAIYNNKDQQVCYKRFFSKNKLYLKAFQKDYLVNIARKYLRNNTFDYCLLRINYIGKNYYNMLKEMKRKGSFVMMESLSYFPNMDFGNIHKASYLMIGNSLKKHEKDLKNVVDLMLTEGELDDFYGIPCIEFGMGVNVEKYKAHQYSGKTEELNLLMVGCDSIYHGTDRIINSLKKYVDEGGTDIRLHLVGDILHKDKKLIEEVDLGDRIVCYGRLFGDKLDKIFDKCNIALGPLAQHRINKKDTGLKTKEYFARGIPYLYTGNEVRIEKEYPYIMQIPDNENLIDLKEVVNFYLCLDSNAVENMREKARNVYSWRSIFEDVFEATNNLQK